MTMTMGRLFGYQLESDFDLGKEERRDRLWWPFFGGVALCLCCRPFLEKLLAVQIFQGWLATSLFFGEKFYVQRSVDLKELWLWKAMGAVLPLHALFLGCLFWVDRKMPGIMTKAVVFLPIILVGLGVESLFAERVIKAFSPKQ